MRAPILTRISTNIAFCTVLAPLAWCQGTFQNLDFELANVPTIPAGQFGANVLSTDGVPGWTPYIGGMPVDNILHNNQSLGAAAIAILGPQWFPQQILEGRYTVLLQPSSPGGSVTAAIGQIGTVPSDAQSVHFYGSGGFTVTFAGHAISLVALGGTATYTLFGGDISAYADQAGELRIQGGGLLDNIVFSNQAIPEPGALALFGLGVLLYLGFGRRLGHRS